MHDKGQGVRQNSFKAVKLYTKACYGGNVNGCNNLGSMYYRGAGVRQSYSKAKEFWGIACDFGSNSACEKYAYLNKQNEDSPELNTLRKLREIKGY